MEFGKTDTSQLTDIDFTLRLQPPENKDVLVGRAAAEPQLYVGCARWGTKEWLGHFYPEHTKEKDFLFYYAKLFNCVELSTTYYRIPTAEQVQQWKSKVNAGFRFCPKFPQFITHVMRLQNCTKEVNEFVNVMFALEENLGPVFLMPHPQMGVSDFSVIKRFIERLPDELDVFLELRHASWFAGGRINNALAEMAAGYNIGLVITDAAGRRDCVHMRLTKPETFVRFVGNDLHPSDYARMQQWAVVLQQWMQLGVQKAYFFMHQHNELQAPLLNKYLLEQLPPAVKKNVPIISAIRQQTTLFD